MWSVLVCNEIMVSEKFLFLQYIVSKAFYVRYILYTICSVHKTFVLAILPLFQS